jgi:phospholipid-binding lipoprotein MlaA
VRRAGSAALVLALGALCLPGCATLRETDPFEPVNRKVFAFNDAVDQWVLAPVARGWDFVAPDLVQRGVSNFQGNLDMPVVLLNDLLVLRVGDALEDFTRLLVNSSVGIGGIVDVAGWAGLPRNDADFGLTLGRWGVPAGPYVVIPIIGPLSARDTVGYAADAFAHPHIYFVPFWVSYVNYTGRAVNFRARNGEEIDEFRAEALDYYVAVRNAYLQNRRARVEGRRDEPAAPDEDLYYYEEDEDVEQPTAAPPSAGANR